MTFRPTRARRLQNSSPTVPTISSVTALMNGYLRSSFIMPRFS